MKLKMHKALSKRVHVTSKGKVLKRHSGQNHFNARDTGKNTRNKRRDQTMSKVYDKTIDTLIHV